MDELHFSQLKLMGRSPAHFKAYVQPDTVSLRTGRAVHSLLFGGERVVCFPERRYGKSWDAFEAEHADCTILNEAEHERTLGMVASVMDHNLAQRLIGLPGMQYEQSLTWQIGAHVCAGRIDAFNTDTLVELKTTKMGKPSWFDGEVRRRTYDAQISWYRNGISCGRPGPSPSECYIIAVESTSPYPTTVFKLTEERLLLGEKTWVLWLEQLLVCEASDCWPGYVDEHRHVDLDVPDDDAYYPDDEAA
jgi:hypothetical protein